MTLTDAIESYKVRNSLTRFKPQAALIDMDGTLFDSMPYHARAWHKLMSELGVACTIDEFFLYEGRTGPDTINMLFKRSFGHGVSQVEAQRLYARKAEYFREMAIIRPIDGADRMVSEFINAGIVTVLVTGSAQGTTLGMLDTVFPGAFPENRRVTANNVTHGKPHPEPFLKAMQLANVPPTESIAIDNAPIGVQSGAASGAFTIGITTGPIPADELYRSGADIVFPTMESLADSLPSMIKLCSN